MKSFKHQRQKRCCSLCWEFPEDVNKTGSGERKNEKWEKKRELEMKLVRGLGLKLDFVSIFHFPVPRSSF